MFLFRSNCMQLGLEVADGGAIREDNCLTLRLGIQGTSAHSTEIQGLRTQCEGSERPGCNALTLVF